MNIHIYGFYIPGNFFWDAKNLPILKRLLFYIKQNIYDPKRVIWNLRSRFYLFLNFIFNVKLDYLFVAGKKYIPKKNLFKKIFEINSWDYSRLKLYKKKIKKKKIYITFLDAPGPLFKSDSFLLKRNNDETAENTYPSLRNFFDNIEKKFGSQVVIAAHPKTKHGNYPKYFGERKVFHNKTLELIHKSNLVITRNSSAITYAIYYKIPIIFIYTKEIKKKKNVNFYNIYYLAKELNLEAININSYKEKLIKKIFNLSKYQDFEKKYFSNINSNKPNHELIHQAIMSNK